MPEWVGPIRYTGIIPVRLVTWSDISQLFAFLLCCWQDQASLDDSDISDNHPGTPPANPPPSPELPVGATDSMGTSQGVASLQHQLAKIQLSEQIMQTKASTSPEST